MTKRNKCSILAIIKKGKGDMYMEQILNEYYKDNARKLRRTVDRILLKFGGLSDRDRDDFYSLANEVFADAIKRHNQSQSFDVFLYSCLSNRIKTEITGRNRKKRRADRLSISIDTPVSEDGSTTVGDMIVDDFSVEREVLEGREGEYSQRMMTYLGRLSRLQKQVLGMNAAGYLPGEIREELQITEKQYDDCNVAIHSYRNISVLF